MLEHICYKKYLDFKPHPLQRQFFESKTSAIYIGGRGAGRKFVYDLPTEQKRIYQLLHKVAEYNKNNPREGIDNE